jgi:hypothetical protein
MSIESLNEFDRGLQIAETVTAQYPHGVQRDAIMMKLAEARAIAQNLFADSIAVPSGAMMGQMS